MHQMHLDEEQIQRTLHGELRREVEAAVKDHLDSCPDCRSRLLQRQQDETWVLERLGTLDHSPPAVTAEGIVARKPRAAPVRARLAAGIFLVLAAAGVAYAAPGSPLPGALRRIVHLIGSAPQPTTRPVAPRLAEEPQVGIAVVPGERLIIELAPEQILDTAVVSLTDGAEVVARARGGTTTFASDADRLVIRRVGPAARLEILIPRGARSVSLRLGGRRLWHKAGSRILSDVSPDSVGRYVVLPRSQKSTSLFHR
jgi:anti-sigma factor RsiW